MTEGELPSRPDTHSETGGEPMETSKTDMDQPWARRDEGIRNGEFTPSARRRRITQRTADQLRRPANLPPGKPEPLGHALRPEYLAGLRKR